jgi:hypothetical protein
MKMGPKFQLGADLHTLILSGVNGCELERVTGIEPAQPAWKAGTLPLSYTRVAALLPTTRPQHNALAQTRP